MTVKKHRLLLGAHMSIAGGLEKSIERGESIGCTTIQIFTKSNRQWHANPLSQSAIDLFKQTAAASTIDPIVVHATYLINIGAADKKVEAASVQALAKELATCQLLDIPYLVLHPGSFVNGTPQEGIARIINNLDTVLEIVPGKSMIILEIMAGQGSVMGTSFEQLATILAGAAHKKRLGICFDTCHAFAAGYDFRSEAGYTKMWHEFDTILGLDALKVIHVNDSKKGLGSRVDRHEHIGKGEIGLEAFSLLFNDPRFFDIPKILETPKETEEPLIEDQKNMETIRGLLTDKTRSLFE